MLKNRGRIVAWNSEYQILGGMTVRSFRAKFVKNETTSTAHVNHTKQQGGRLPPAYFPPSNFYKDAF